MDSGKAIVILGMHRSGTSVLTRALRCFNIDLGKKLMTAREDNPKGFFEDSSIVAFNDALLAQCGGQWSSFNFDPDLIKNEFYELQKKALEIIQTNFVKGSDFAVKDPRICRLLPFWESVFPLVSNNTYYLLANRHPLSVFHSLNKRNRIEKEHALTLWLIHQVSGLEKIMETQGLVVDYDQMIENPGHELDKISGFLKLPIDAKEKETFLSQFLDENLRHTVFADEKEEAGDSPLETICGELFAYIAYLGRQSAPYDGEIVSRGEVLIKKIRGYLATQTEKLLFADSIFSCCQFELDQTEKLHLEHRKLLTQKIESQSKKIGKLQSELDWIQNKPIFKWLSQLKSVLKLN